MDTRDFVAYTTASVVKKIIMNIDMSFQEASEQFLRSKTYELLVENPQLYSSETPDYFYQLWQKEQQSIINLKSEA
ncbi:hypothetical protein GCM10022297_00110 [Lactobacillus hamsteri]|uniref:hypothetical protein n=1 Tax=Lactobacillus hamsteri TaxID=96565 RepID=UPI00046838BB|nr:hypothetical protein [Lactobacillus hamsteri]